MAELKLQQSRLDGRYDIVECLGRGSYAEIYVARDNAAAVGSPTTVVIKALNTFLQDTPDLDLERTLVENFQNEAVALDRVRHPNVINRLGHGTAIDLAGTTFHYIVLEYLPGGDMAAMARNHPLPIDKALFYLGQVSSGLAHAHACGVIHRDIKPQNLLLNSDRTVVKIADFGVARLESTEGAITRVGTNIYAAPEHNPLVHTGALDPDAIHKRRDQVTPAADIYSLAKTTYTLLAGESPRRFAQYPITQLPDAISGHYWSAGVLRVLQTATSRLPEDRYQTVQAFWDELADAALPPTTPLPGLDAAARRRPSADLKVGHEAIPQAPPEARFSLTAEPDVRNENVDSGDDETGYAKSLPPQNFPATSRVEPERRPKIVVPVSELEARRHQKGLDRSVSGDSRAATTAASAVAAKGHKRRPVDSRRGRSLLVAAILIAAFVGMLLATHRYVTSQWNPLVGVERLGDLFVIGREGVTTTDVNLRPSASAANPAIGLAESGSRVKVLASEDNWYEVQVLQHGRPKTDPFTSDRGWINKRFVKFD